MTTISHDIKIKKMLNGGFSRIKPDPVPINYYGYDISSSIVDKYKLFILKNMPYRYLVTITFARYMNYQTSCEHTSRLLRFSNNKIFGRGYYKRNEYIDGFAFIENHTSGKSINDHHVHMLVKPHYRYRDLTSPVVTDVFKKCALKIVDGKNKKVFGSHCVHLGIVWDDGAVIYCSKQIKMNNVDRIKMLCAHGLSDTL